MQPTGHASSARSANGAFRLTADGEISGANVGAGRYPTLAGSAGGCPLHLETGPSVKARRQGGPGGQPLDGDVRATTASARVELGLSTRSGPSTLLGSRQKQSLTFELRPPRSGSSETWPSPQCQVCKHFATFPYMTKKSDGCTAMATFA
jgi:hypothetical protein